MNDEFKMPLSAPVDPELPTMGMSAVYRLFEAFIALREKNERQHKLFEQTLNRTRDSMQSSFNSFAGDTQKAYQQLRQDVLGEKKFSLTLLNVILDLGIEMNHILDSRPKHLPAGEVYVETECPRGQMGFGVVGRPAKENVPLRVRARSSCFCNLSVTGELCRGCLVADIPAIIGSIDVVMGEIDR